MHKPLVYKSQHKRHPLTASRASAERTRCCAAGSTSKHVCFSATFLLNGSDKRQQSSRIRELDVWAVCGRLYSLHLSVVIIDRIIYHIMCSHMYDNGSEDSLRTTEVVERLKRPLM